MGQDSKPIVHVICRSCNRSNRSSEQAIRRDLPAPGASDRERAPAGLGDFGLARAEASGQARPSRTALAQPNERPGGRRCLLAHGARGASWRTAQPARGPCELRRGSGWASGPAGRPRRSSPFFLSFLLPFSSLSKWATKLVH
jgi:hypothetical protein